MPDGTFVGRRFLVYPRDQQKRVNVRRLLAGYGIKVLYDLGDDIVVAVATEDVLRRLKRNNPAISFEADRQFELLAEHA